MSIKKVLASAGLSLALAVPAAAQTVRLSSSGETTRKTVQQKGDIDYAGAKPAPMPQLRSAPRSQLEMLARPASPRFPGPPELTPGGEGDGREDPVRLAVPQTGAEDELPAPPEFGTSGQPYTTTLEDLSKADPQRRAGKIFFKNGGETFVCSGALINRGLILTAAHCVAQFGARRFFDNWRFVPGYRNGAAPYGEWRTQSAYVPNSYYDGSAFCTVTGVTCENDVAILVAEPKGGDYPGQRVGWFGYGTNGFGFTPLGQALVTQLGYPTSLNRGQRMIRTDSQGGVDGSLADNTIIGSLQTGGSSGGPWIINFGDAASLSDGLKRGSRANRNVIVGVTSWGYVGTGAGIKQQGASPFTSQNLGVLVKEACRDFPRACR
jgi:V8-like Glu-specific endopeptidase